jgi:hypothetical protein
MTALLDNNASSVTTRSSTRGSAADATSRQRLTESIAASIITASVADSAVNVAAVLDPFVAAGVLQNAATRLDFDEVD